VKDIDKHKCLQPYSHAAFIYTRNHRELYPWTLLRNADAEFRPPGKLAARSEY
jgi:hypothetical protein